MLWICIGILLKISVLDHQKLNIGAIKGFFSKVRKSEILHHKQNSKISNLKNI